MTEMQSAIHIRVRECDKKLVTLWCVRAIDRSIDVESTEFFPLGLNLVLDFDQVITSMELAWS